jgi:hypothetical protein
VEAGATATGPLDGIFVLAGATATVALVVRTLGPIVGALVDTLVGAFIGALVVDAFVGPLVGGFVGDLVGGLVGDLVGGNTHVLMVLGVPMAPTGPP